MLLLELFKGTGSIGKVAKKMGYKVISLDMDPKFKPDIVTNILEWDPPASLKGKVDVVWASPPCTEYSIAKTTGIRDFKTADAIVKKTLAIIDYIKPRYWFMENSRGLLQSRPFMKKLEPYKKTVTYCSYDASFPPKPTNIWTNCDDWDVRFETKKKPCGNTHINPVTGRLVHTELIETRPLCERYKIPSKLVKTMLNCTL